VERELGTENDRREGVRRRRNSGELRSSKDFRQWLPRSPVQPQRRMSGGEAKEEDRGGGGNLRKSGSGRRAFRNVYGGNAQTELR
jgi:hypothetical protein